MSSLTRSITQEILMPLGLQSSRTSKKIRDIFSQIDSSREDLIKKDKIKTMYLGFEKIGLPIHAFTDKAFFLTRLILPSDIPVLSGKTWLHASLLLKTENGYSICVEYGGYKGEDMVDKENNNYPSYYYDKNRYGVRFLEISYYNYINKKVDYDTICLHPYRKLTLEEALDECHYDKIWIYKNYDLANQNCQDFVAKFIEVTDAYRYEGEDYRGLHNISSTKIPKVILKQIEKNEDDGWNTVGKVPIFGPIISGIHGLIAKIKGDYK